MRSAHPSLTHPSRHRAGVEISLQDVTTTIPSIYTNNINKHPTHLKHSNRCHHIFDILLLGILVIIVELLALLKVLLDIYSN